MTMKGSSSSRLGSHSVFIIPAFQFKICLLLSSRMCVSGLGVCLARLALWMNGEETDFQRLVDAIHPDLFHAAVDSVIQTARNFNRQQQGLRSKEVRSSRQTPDEVAMDFNCELGRRKTTYPWAVTESRTVTYPDDVRAAFQKDRFVLEEEVRRFRFQGDTNAAGKFLTLN